GGLFERSLTLGLHALDGPRVVGHLAVDDGLALLALLPHLLRPALVLLDGLLDHVLPLARLADLVRERLEGLARLLELLLREAPATPQGDEALVDTLGSLVQGVPLLDDAREVASDQRVA